MNREELRERLRMAAVILTVDGDRLRYRAPTGALTPELRAALADVKPDLLYEYHERAGILQYDARMPRLQAETSAHMAIFSVGPCRKGDGGTIMGGGVRIRRSSQ